MTENTSHENLSTRLTGYRHAAQAVAPGAAIAAVGAWTLGVQPAEAIPAAPVVPDLLFSNPDSQGVVTIDFGSDGMVQFGFTYNNDDIHVHAFRPGQVGFSQVPMSATIGYNLSWTSSYRDAPPIDIDGVLPLRVDFKSNTYFGWGSFGSFSGAFSSIPGVPVIAGLSAATAVPEPSTALPLLLMGAVGVALNRRRKQAAA